MKLQTKDGSMILESVNVVLPYFRKVKKIDIIMCSSAMALQHSVIPSYTKALANSIVQF